MTELEKMQRAKMYLDQLANGVDPITGQVIEHDTTLNNVRLSRCFFYVSDLLRQIIDNGGQIGRRRQEDAMEDFALSPEKAQEFVYDPDGLTVGRITDGINALIDQSRMKKFPVGAITRWMESQGYFENKMDLRGKKHRNVTPAGEEAGLRQEVGQSIRGEFQYVVYEEKAQRLVLENLENIMAYRKEKREMEGSEA